jgi:hypothetical protein
MTARASRAAMRSVSLGSSPAVKSKLTGKPPC